MWQDQLKQAGVSIHVIATGAGANIQNILWATPGSSAYLSGASFPYSAEEQAELLGFMPEHFCSPEAAVDLASAAYIKAYQFGGNKPVGLGLTASVASEKEHRGDHRVHACIITDDHIWIRNYTLFKNAGIEARRMDGESCDELGIFMIKEALGLEDGQHDSFEDGTQLALQRFNSRCLFMANERRLDPKMFNSREWSLMPGTFNPPHQGHFSLAHQVQIEYNTPVIFEVCATPPHKPALTVQQMLQRVKLLRGHPVLFTNHPLYLDKARAYPGVPFVVGADTMLRILDPQWGVAIQPMLAELEDLCTDFLIGSRMVDGKLVSRADILNTLSPDLRHNFGHMFRPVAGRWDISSTEIRNKVI